MSRYVMALDQGTTSSRAILFDREGAIAAVDQHEFTQHFPKPGWVEHDAEEIWRDASCAPRAARSRRRACHGARRRGDRHHEPARDDRRLGPRRRASRSTARSSGSRAGPRRSARSCARAGSSDEVRARTGLVIDAYFSGTKVRWILDAVPGAQRARGARRARLRHDRHWLLCKLTGGRVHATEYTNASRTMLYDIHARRWDDAAARASSTSRARCCPRCATRAASSARPSREWLGAAVPIAGIAGDQQAALFGQGCCDAGQREEHLRHRLLPADEHRRRGAALEERLLTTVAWGIGGRVEYALEGSVFIAGAAVQWLRDGLGLITTPPRARRWRARCPTPAASTSCRRSPGSARRTGTSARAARSSASRAARRRAHLVRAALEAIAYQTRDVVECMRSGRGRRARRAARRRRRRRERLPDAVPGRRARRPGRAARDARDDRARRRGARRPRGRLLAATPQRARAAPRGATRLRAAHARGRARGALRGWRRAVERSRGWAQR